MLLRALALLFACAPAGARAGPAGEAEIKISPLADWQEIRDPGTSRWFTIDTQKAAAGTTVRVPARTRMVEVDGFLTELRPGHRYRLTPDPCCTIALWDDTAPASDLPGQSCADEKYNCSKPDQIALPGFLGHGSCGERSLCVPAARLRFRISPALAAGGAILVHDESDELLWTLRASADSKYNLWQHARESSPTRLRFTQGGRVLWQGRVQFRLGHRYTLVVSSKLEILLDD